MNGNNGKCGKLFVIEGLDGCGKSTQLEMLKASADSNIRFISFPNYNSASGEISRTISAVNSARKTAERAHIRPAVSMR